MSTINVDIVDPQSGNTVTVNGVNLSSPNSDPTNIAIGIVPTSVSGSSHNNTLIGGGAAGGLTTGTQNTAIGTYACLGLTTGSDNVAIGINPLFANVNGSENVAIGNWAASSQLTGSGTVAIGKDALRNATVNANTAIGRQSLLNVSTGVFNTAIGGNSGTLLTTGNGNVIVGYNAQPSTATASNEFTLGSTGIAILRCAVTSITSLSDARDKKEITELSAGLDFVNTLKPVEFIWDDRAENGKHDVKDFGFIAQDLKQSQEDIKLADTLKLVYEENPEKLEASYGKLIPILVKAIQELSAEVTSLKKK
jgi:trimeric autotransporter adhesin